MARGLVCDFCSAPNPKWRYEVDDFVLWQIGALGGRGLGGWAACDVCKVHIDAGDRERLTLQMYESLLHLNPELNTVEDAVLEGMRRSLRTVADEFFKHRRSSS